MGIVQPPEFVTIWPINTEEEFNSQELFLLDNEVAKTVVSYQN